MPDAKTSPKDSLPLLLLRWMLGFFFCRTTHQIIFHCFTWELLEQSLPTYPPADSHTFGELFIRFLMQFTWSSAAEEVENKYGRGFQLIKLSRSKTNSTLEMDVHSIGFRFTDSNSCSARLGSVDEKPRLMFHSSASALSGKVHATAKVRQEFSAELRNFTKFQLGVHYLSRGPFSQRRC